MKNFSNWRFSQLWFIPPKIKLVMRLSLGLLFIACFNVLALSSFSQESKVSLRMRNVEVKAILEEIEEQSNYRFIYDNDLVNVNRIVSVDKKESRVVDVLDELFGTDVRIVLVDNQIILSVAQPEYAMETQQQQTIMVKGRVLDTGNDPIPGVNVFEKDNLSNGTITNIDGEYQLELSNADAQLVFSFVGFESQTIQVAGKTTINITMVDEAIDMDEVVVVGYGTMRKSDLTGAVASVSTDDLNSLPVPSVGNALQGKATGVQVIDNGTPGSDPTFRIRGLGTINNNNPLYVIDGIPTDGGLNQLNTNDIESIQILKDASSTAIYGSRGANGVVIITTKSGEQGKSQLQFNAYYGVQQSTNMVEVLNASEFAALHNEMMANAGRTQNPAFADPASLGKGTDWVDELFVAAPIQSYSLSYSGGTEKTTYYVSGNVFSQDGIIDNTGFDKYTFKFNTESQVFEKLKFGNNLTLNHDKKYSGDYSIRNSLLALPTLPIYNEDGSYAGPKERPEWDGDIINPVGKNNLVERQTLGYNLLGSVYADLEIIEGLTLKSLAGLKANFWYDRNWAPKYNWQPTPQDLSFLSESSNRANTWNWDNTLTYTKSFGKHDITAMVGTSAQESEWHGMNGSIQDFASDQTQQLNNGSKQPDIGGNTTGWSMMSYMARVNYTYDDKYLFTATIRRDGSSRFGNDSKWGTFPSASLAWRISEEDFFENIDFVDNLKLRVGYGSTGNQEIGLYEYASVLNTGVYTFNNGIVSTVVPNRMPNPNLHWEAQKMSNVGIDASLFNQTIDLTVDTYYKVTEDMLVPMSVPISTGYSDIDVPKVNAGEITNKGIEVSVTSHNMKGEFEWDTDVNFSFNRNEVVQLNDSIPMTRGSVGFNQDLARLATGHPMDVFYGYVTDGVFQNQEEVNNHAVQVPGNDPYNRTSPGDIRFKDLNSDGVINAQDRTYIGNPNPDFLFSLNNRFAYKGFDLTIFLQGVFGNDIYNANRIWNEGMAVAYNQSDKTLERWTGEGTSSVVPRAVFNDPNQNSRPSDRYIEDGSYLRIKNVTLGYNLPENWYKKTPVSSARIYISGTNLYTFTSYEGFDPEVGVSGIDNNVYPVTRTISVGANISF
jgi:TonB-linked SusC/RagA family outer membrane protein